MKHHLSDIHRYHSPRLVTSKQTHPHSGVNKAVAVWITDHVGTMWAAYAFALIAMVSFGGALHAFITGDTVSAVAWLSQSFLQLVLLPVIMVGQSVQQSHSDEVALADHQTLTALMEVNKHQLELLEAFQGGKK